jgi:deoxyxylulose-5-phosphate synthase
LPSARFGVEAHGGRLAAAREDDPDHIAVGQAIGQALSLSGVAKAFHFMPVGTAEGPAVTFAVGGAVVEHAPSTAALAASSSHNP